MSSNNPFTRGALERSSRNMDSSKVRAKHMNYVNVVVGRGDTAGVVAKSYNSEQTPTASTNQNGGQPMSKSDEKVAHPAGSDAHYTQQLRRGFIDLRASYSEKRKPRNAYLQGSHAPGAVPQRKDGVHEMASARHRDIRPYAHRGLKSEGKGLYRSNSSLEIDYIDDDDTTPTVHRVYGSTSSLDMIGNQNNGESFFQLLQGYRHDNVDQRAPAPPKVQDLLKPRSPTEQARIKAMAQSTSNNIVRLTQRLDNLPQNAVSNGSVPVEDQADSGQGSPKLKSKSQKSKDRKSRNKSMVSEAGGGIFKKLRGKSELSTETGDKSEVNTALEAELYSEERTRRKAFLYYDIQSLCVSLLDVIRRRKSDLLSGNEPLRNMITGASAASGANKSLTTAEPDKDPGDGKSSDLVHSCPFFRNELGLEEERCIALCRSTAMKRTQQLLGNENMDSGALRRHPVCNGIAVLDCCSNAQGKSVPTIQSHRGLTVEYFDHGAHYYRYFFNESGKKYYFVSRVK